MGPGIPISQLPLITNYNLELNGSEQIAIARDSVTYKTDLLDVGNYYWTSLGIDNLAALSGGWQETFITVTNRSFFWDSVYSSVAATSGSWDSVYSTVNELSDYWDGDFCNETVFLSTVSGCGGEPINMSDSSLSNINSITANEIHTLSSFTHYQDILISELSGFEVGGSVEVAEKVTIGSLNKGAETLNVNGTVLVENGWISLSGTDNSGEAFITRDGTDGGIGFTGTANKLIENGGVGADLYIDNNGSTATRGNLSVNTDQTVSKVTIKGGDIAIDSNSNGNWGFIGQGSTGSGIGFRGAGGNTSEQLHLNVAQGGNVGIGTETPSSKLNIVDGDLRLDDAAGTSRTFVTDFGTIELCRDGGRSYIDFKDQIGQDFDSRIMHLSSNDLEFYTGGNGNTQKSLILTSSGDAIVYGTLSASCGNSEEWCSTTTTVESLSDAWNRSLSVSVSATPPPAQDRLNGDLWFDSSSGDLYMWYIDGTSDQWIDINALGGAGSAYCDTTLFLNQVSACNGEMFIEGDVNVDGKVESNTSIIAGSGGSDARLLDGRIEIKKDGGAPYIDFKSTQNDYDTRIKSTTSGKLTIDVGGDGSIINDAFVISNDGNIGIGETNPQNKLQIQDGDIALLGATVGGAGFITQDGTTGGIGLCGNSTRLNKSGGVGADLYVTDGGGTLTRGNLTVGGSITGTGNVTLSGGTEPASGFLLNSNAGGIEIIDGAGTDNPYIDFKTARDEGHDCRIIQSDNGLKFNTGGDGNVSTAVTIASGGRVDIGNFTNTVANASALRVLGQIAVNGNDDGNFGFIGQGDNQNGIGLRGYGPGLANSFDLYVRDTGYVGIGTLDPFTKLQVVGEITLTSTVAGGDSGFITNDGTGVGALSSRGIGLCGAASRLPSAGGAGADLYVTDSGDTVARNSLTVQGPAVIVPQSRPSSPVAGTIIFNSGTNVFEGFTGTAWVQLS